VEGLDRPTFCAHESTKLKKEKPESVLYKANCKYACGIGDACSLEMDH
jgi:hypothetical protein